MIIVVVRTKEILQIKEYIQKTPQQNINSGLVVQTKTHMIGHGANIPMKLVFPVGPIHSCTTHSVGRYLDIIQHISVCIYTFIETGFAKDTEDACLGKRNLR